MAHANGQGGSVTVGATTYSVLSWQGDDEAAPLKTTGTGDGGFYTGITAPNHMSGSFEIAIDVANPPTTALKSGVQGAASFPLANSGKPYTGTINILKFSVKNPADGLVTGTVNWEFTGPYTTPA